MKSTIKWSVVFAYTVGIFIVTPSLPKLISFASSQFSSAGVSHFVLWVEIAIALSLISLAIVFLIKKRKKSAFFLISIGGICLLSFIIYQFLPNPYEFTHIPEYAILSILIVRTLDKNKGLDQSTAQGLALDDNKGRAGDLKKETDIGSGSSRALEKKEEELKYGIIQNSYLLSGIITSMIGAGDEVYQHFIPGRFFTWYDIFLNAVGGVLGLLVYWGIKK